MAFQTGFAYLDDFELGNPLEPGICIIHGEKEVGKSRFTKEVSIYNALSGTKVCYFFYADTVPEQMTEKQYLGKIAEELMEEEGAPTLFGMGQKAEEKYREELKDSS